jgi:hypothetical protein
LASNLITQSEVKEKNDLALESELQRQIEQDLNRRNIICIHSKFGVKPTIASGLPDFMFCILQDASKMLNNSFIWGKLSMPIALECKLPGEKLSDDQQRVMELMCNNGWIYKTVYTFGEYSQWLNYLLI